MRKTSLRRDSLILSEILRAYTERTYEEMSTEVAFAFWEALRLVHQNRVDEAIERVAKYC
jgi:hypothetical protein